MKIEELSIGNFVLYVDQPGVFRVVGLDQNEMVSLLPHYLTNEQACDFDYICTEVNNLRPLSFDSYHIDTDRFCQLNNLEKEGKYIRAGGFSSTRLHLIQNYFQYLFGNTLELSGCIIDQPETKPEPEPVKDMDYVIKRLDEIVKWFEERGH